MLTFRRICAYQFASSAFEVYSTAVNFAPVPACQAHTFIFSPLPLVFERCMHIHTPEDDTPLKRSTLPSSL